MKEGWTYKKLEEVCEVFCDGDWIESKNQSADGIRLIQTGNVGNGVYKDKADKSKYISEKTFKELNCTEIFAGDILVSRLPDPIGRACVVPKSDSRMITAVDCTIIKVKDYLNSKFFVYYTQSKEYSRYIEKYTTGATRKRISRSNLGLIKVPFPSLIKQQQIVSELDLLSDVIEKKKVQIEELDRLAQSTFYDMFGDPVTNEKGWETRSLNSVAPQAEYKGRIPEINGKYWLLNLDMVKSMSGEVIDQIMLPISEIGSSTIKFDDKNVLYSKLRPYLNKVVLPKEKGYATSELVPLKPDAAFLKREFLVALLRCNEFVEYISIKVQGAKMPRVSMNVLRSFPVILPPLALQQEFAAKIEAIEQMKAKVRQSLKETEELFNSRMDYYFN